MTGSQTKPFAPACERNREPILAHLAPLLEDRSDVLEIGSGTGQHAVFFGAAMPHLTWQTSDIEANHAGIQAWLDEARLPNVRAPLRLDVRRREDWPEARFDAVFTANTLHIMPWSAGETLLTRLKTVLRLEGLFLVYGPFRYDGAFTSESNAAFDRQLRAADPAQGIRDFEDVERCLRASGLYLAEDIPMPANNQLLVFAKTDDV